MWSSTLRQHPTACMSCCLSWVFCWRFLLNELMGGKLAISAVRILGLFHLFTTLGEWQVLSNIFGDKLLHSSTIDLRGVHIYQIQEKRKQLPVIHITWILQLAVQQIYNRLIRWSLSISCPWGPAVAVLKPVVDQHDETTCTNKFRLINASNGDCSS